MCSWIQPVCPSIKKSAGLAKSQTAPEAHNVLDGDDAAEEERRFVVTCTKDQARATMLFPPCLVYGWKVGR